MLSEIEEQLWACACPSEDGLVGVADGEQGRTVPMQGDRRDDAVQAGGQVLILVDEEVRVASAQSLSDERLLLD